MDKLHKKIRELQAQGNRDLICLALKLKEATYYQMVYDTGLEWIKLNMSMNDDEIIHVIASCRFFWSWWRNQFEIRDKQFIYQTSLDRLKKQEQLPLDSEYLTAATQVFLHMHDAKMIKIIPGRFVIGEVNTALRRFNAEQIEKLRQLIHGK